MNIEVIHNIDKLPCQRVLKVTNAAQAYAKLQRLMETKRSRGMRLRFSYDVKSKTVSLEGRNTLGMDIAQTCLSDAGFLRR